MNLAVEARRNLIRKMLGDSGVYDDRLASFLGRVSFETQDDGGMGSFSVLSGERREGLTDLAEATYIDEDGLEVVIALIVDSEGYPTDMDFWKVDSSRLVKFPEPGDIRASRVRPVR